jgi:hypothetical protein
MSILAYHGVEIFEITQQHYIVTHGSKLQKDTQSEWTRIQLSLI